jgi:uncharacterized protein YyaL (SSP411 family)
MIDSAEGRNRLARESSPYLRQHADNPVDWYPWGEEAFAKARAEDKPVLVSIGYSSCHWCHVMEHESFEDPSIAALMNERFVCIKVDREERPDVDEIYMSAMQLMGIAGGWPLNVFVTPEGRPFFGGTYFPPAGRYGRHGWPEILEAVSSYWREQRETADGHAAQLVEAITSLADFPAVDALPEAALLREATERLRRNVDSAHGGFGGAPKFPPHQALRFLLRRWRRTGEVEVGAIVEKTLRAMAAGGMYDQLGGGFHRYSVDERWLVPHFEKMLYDNAQLARVYLEAHQLTGDTHFARIARETLDYALREMTSPAGGFHSATDADSDGREGLYFVWTRTEIERLLGGDAPLFCRAYGVSTEGNFADVHHPAEPGAEGMNVLHVAMPLAELARESGLEETEVERRLAAGRARLLEQRRRRTPPGLDDKVLASWNALMIGAMAYGGRVLDEPRYREAAERAAAFVLGEMRDERGRLLRTWRSGTAKIPAFLEDYAFLADALLDLYEATFALEHFRAARELADEMNRSFWDEKDGGWFHTPASSPEDLIARMKSPGDGALPAGNAVAARVMVRLAVLSGDTTYRARAERSVKLFARRVERFPESALGILLVVDELLHQDGEIAIVGDPEAEATRELVHAIHALYLAGTALALRDPSAGEEVDEDAGRFIPLVRGKTLVNGAPAVYICQDFACRQPLTSAAEVGEALAQR